jgi:hypothetical protein
MYASLGTRPDIPTQSPQSPQSHIFSGNLGMPHWDAVRHIYCYLLGIQDLKLVYEDRRAVSGYVFSIDGSTVSWSSKPQEIVSLSTTENDHYARRQGSTLAFGHLLASSPLPSPPLSPTISLLSRSPKTTNITLVPVISTIVFTFNCWIVEECVAVANNQALRHRT